MTFTPNAPGVAQNDDLTPLMKQYYELKAKAGDSLLLFRMGDFYELFGEDAVRAAEILQITLTSRDKNKPNPLPMAGVPHHSVQGYIQKLLKAGKKVAISEQFEDAPEKNASQKTSAKAATKIVRREIVRILTPAIQFDADAAETHYLATLTNVTPATSTPRWILSCLEPSTGETLLGEPLDAAAIANELRQLPICHFLHVQAESAAHALPQEILSALPAHVLIESLPRNYLSLERAIDLLKRQYEIENLNTFIPSPSAYVSLGTLLVYTLRTQQLERLAHLRLPEPLQKAKSMVLGPNTAQHLDLPDLFLMLNRTRSALGARQLKRWLMAPLNDSKAISQRQAAVKELADGWSRMGEKTSTLLGQIYDLERICGRVNTGLANPRDTLALGQSLDSFSKVLPLFTNIRSPLLRNLHQEAEALISELRSLYEKVIQIQNEDAPLTSKDGGIFKHGTTPELDRLISLTEDGHRWLVELETRERELTKIPSLKVRYTRVFGYYIEITQAHLKNVPPHYQRKQTMVGAERFFTEELKKFEEEILTAAVKQKAMELELFQKLLIEIQSKTQPLMQTARAIGDLDALLSLSVIAQYSGWSFPCVDDSMKIEILAGRHPLVDEAKRGSFVPNDFFLSPEARMTLLITGPNMGGKSTIMRQVAVIVILGQMGSPVPARDAKWGVFSSVYTRIGAQDAIARGQSTFMVEMSELAHILHHADPRSLIILDEIGRGTSTYDGMSVAWSTLEWICTRIQARTLFATHYHELVRLSDSLPLLANAHMAVEGTKSQNQGQLRFLYLLQEGPTNESFGIQVAQMAGLPKPVIQRAWKVLDELEASGGKGATHEAVNQLSLFGSFQAPVEPEATVVVSEIPAEPHPVILELAGLKIDEMTPIQALNTVARLQSLATAAVS